MADEQLDRIIFYVPYVFVFCIGMLCGAVLMVI